MAKIVSENDPGNMRQYSLNSLLVQYRKINFNHYIRPEWEMLIIDENDNSCQVDNIAAVLGEIKIRSLLGMGMKAPHEILPTLASNNVVRIEPSKPIVVHTLDKKVVPTVEIAKVTVVADYEKAQERVSNEIIAEQALLGLVGVSKEGKKILVDDKVAQNLGVPLCSTANIVPEQLPKREIVHKTAAMMTADPVVRDTWCKKLVSTYPDYDFNTMSANVKGYRKSATNIDDMWRVIHENRLFRRDDDYVSAGYYFGPMPHHMARCAWAFNDFEALSTRLGSKRLEVDGPGGAVTQYLLHSLVHAGWIIRCVNGIGLPEYTGQTSGLFKYFPFEETVETTVEVEVKSADASQESGKPLIEKRNVLVTKRLPYLRYINLGDVQPVVSQGNVSYKDCKVVLEDKLRREIDPEAIPFFYIYMRDGMMDYVKNFPMLKDYVPQASSHAHAGQILFIKGEVLVPFNWVHYCRRVADANLYKTFFPLNRVRYWEIDPYAVSMVINLVNMQESGKKKKYVKELMANDIAALDKDPEIIPPQDLGLRLFTRVEKLSPVNVPSVIKYNLDVAALAKKAVTLDPTVITVDATKLNKAPDKPTIVNNYNMPMVQAVEVSLDFDSDEPLPKLNQETGEFGNKPEKGDT